MRPWGKLLGSVLAIMMMAASAAAEVIDYLGIPGPIAFDGQTYELAWSSAPSSGYAKQEYLPAGQRPDAFKQLLLLERIMGNVKVMDAVRSQVDMLKKRKATDPLVNMNILQRDVTGEVLLDFIVSTKDKKGEYVIEWNAYRYTPYHDPSGNPGVLLFGVSHRAYGNDNAKTFLAGLKQLRPAQIKILAGTPLPKPGK